MGTTVIVVQHGEKERRPGDSGLTELGRAQAKAAGVALRLRSVSAVVSSPMRRAAETASIVADVLRLEASTDVRLRERMNWDDAAVQSIEQFLDEWRQASTDRDFVPRRGDSSRAAGDRFIEAITGLARQHSGDTVAVVAHGGVTTDALRTLVGDDRLQTIAPTLIDDGVPCGALTTLWWDSGGWALEQIAATDHLDAATAHRPA